MNLQQAYLEGKKEGYTSLCLLIEFLIMEKQVLSFEDDESELELYFKPNNQKRMNKLLIEYGNEKYRKS